MKKLTTFIAIILSFVFILSFTGCTKPEDEEAIFNGSFTEASAEQVAQLKTEFADKEIVEDGNNKIIIEMEMSSAGVSMEMSGSILMNAPTLQDITMGGTLGIKMQREGTSISMDASYYYTDGYLYTNASGQKVKMRLGIEDSIDEIVGVDAADFDIEEILDFAGLQYTTDGDLVKLKFATTEDGLSVEAVYAINKVTNKIVAQRVVMSGTSQGETIYLKVAYIPTSETVSLPSDLDTYILTSSNF